MLTNSLTTTHLMNINMNTHDKRKRAAVIAVSYYLQEEVQTSTSKWAQTGKELIMRNRQILQQRGRVYL